MNTEFYTTGATLVEMVVDGEKRWVVTEFTDKSFPKVSCPVDENLLNPNECLPEYSLELYNDDTLEITIGENIFIAFHDRNPFMVTIKFKTWAFEMQPTHQLNFTKKSDTDEIVQYISDNILSLELA